MARIYNQAQFEGSFQSSAQSQSFAPETAIDYSRQEKAKADAANAQEKVKMRALDRQASLDKGMLTGKQTIETARQTISNSKANASLSLMKGLAGLSTSAASAVQKFSDEAEARDKDNKMVDAAFNVTSSVEERAPDPVTVKATEREFDNVTLNNSNEEGLQSIDVDPNTAEAIRSDNNQPIAIQQVQRGNVYASANEYGGFHNQYVNDASRAYVRPDGTSFTFGTIRDAADIALIDNSARAEFYRLADVSGMPRSQVASSLAPVVINTGNSFRANQNSSLNAGRTKDRVENARISTEKALAGNEDISLVFQQGASALWSSGDYTGNRGGANSDTVKTILNWAVRNNRPDVIESLAKTEKIPGNTGTRLEGQYNELFENAREGVINEKLEDDQRGRREADNAIVMAERDRQVSLAEAATPEQEREINLAAADSYEALGTPEGRLKAAQLRAEPNYSPFTALDLQEQRDQGAVFSNDELGGLLANGEITAKEAKSLGWSANGTSVDSEANKRANALKSETEAQGKAAVLAALNVPGTVVKTSEDRRIIMESKGKSIIQNLSDNLQQELTMGFRDGSLKTDKDARDFLTRRGKEMAGLVSADTEGNLSYDFQSQDAERTVDISDVVPTLSMSNSKNKGNLASDFRSFPPSDLSARGDIAITSDLILNEREFLIAGDAISRGKPLPKAIEDKAKALGTNAETLIRAQYGLRDRELPSPPPKPDNAALTSQGRGATGKYDTGEVIGGASLDMTRNAIVGKESANNYQAVNPHSGALGYGQVMPENVGPWSREILGYTLSQREFLRNPDLQMQIINGKFRKIMQSQEAAGHTGDILIRRSASIWYSGRGDLYNNTRPQTYGAGSYPSIQSYTLDVLDRYRAG